MVIAIAAQIALFLPAIDAGTNYDEGVYLGSIFDLQAGQQLGTDVVAAQPPGFYAGLRIASFVFGDTVQGVRIGVLAAFALGAIGAFLIGRSLGGRVGGLLAVTLVGLAPPVPLFAVRVLADLPSIWLMLLALGLGAVAPAGPRLQRATACGGGAVLGVAMLVKPTAAIGIIPLAILLSRRPDRRRALPWAFGGLAVSVVVFLLAYRTELRALWSTVVEYRRRASELPNLLSANDVFEQILNARAAFTWIVVLAIAILVSVAVRRRSLRPFVPLVVPAVLLALALIAIVTYKPLHENHVVLLSEVLAIGAATSLGLTVPMLGRRTGLVVLVAASVLVAGTYMQARARVAREYAPVEAEITALAARLAAVTDPGSLVVSDQPIVPYLAHRETPGQLVDTAALRFATRTLTEGQVLREIDENCVAAVVIGRMFSTRPTLVSAIRGRFDSVETTSAGTLFFDRAGRCESGVPVRP